MCRDFIFIDALHENHFAKWYVSNILQPAVLQNTKTPSSYARPVAIQIHDIYNPYLIDDENKKCLRHSLNAENIKIEIECLTGVAESFLTNGVLQNPSRQNGIYGPDALSGEGYVVADFLAHLPFDAQVFTVSPFRDLPRFEALNAARVKSGVQNTGVDMHIYNPSIFFTIPAVSYE